jgi:hypothetical protein
VATPLHRGAHIGAPLVTFLQLQIASHAAVDFASNPRLWPSAMHMPMVVLWRRANRSDTHRSQADWAWAPQTTKIASVNGSPGLDKRARGAAIWSEDPS